MKKFLSMVLTLVMLCSLLVPSVSAAVEPRDSAYFQDYGTTLAAESGGVIHITFSTTGIKLNTSIGVSTYEVEKLNDDGEWVNVSGLLNGETGSGVFSYTFSRDFQGVPGETYRVQAVFICVRTDGYETKTYTSGRITAKR